MAINSSIKSKFITFDTLSDFLSALDKSESAARGGLPESQTNYVPYRSVVFIKDTNEIWTHGKFFGCLPKGVNGSTIGLVKSDGSIDTTSYASQQDLEDAIADKKVHVYHIQTSQMPASYSAGQTLPISAGELLDDIQNGVQSIIKYDVVLNGNVAISYSYEFQIAIADSEYYQAGFTATAGAMQTAFVLKIPFERSDSNVEILQNEDITLAQLDSPEFTGTPTAPTASAGTNTTQIATTAFVQSALSSLASALTFKGLIDAGSESTYNMNTHYPNPKVGDVYIVSSAGVVRYYDQDGQEFMNPEKEVGDAFVCIETKPEGSSVTSYPRWAVLQTDWSASAGSQNLAWNSAVTLATVGGVQIKAKMPAKPTASEIGAVATSNVVSTMPMSSNELASSSSSATEITYTNSTSSPIKIVAGTWNLPKGGDDHSYFAIYDSNGDLVDGNAPQDDIPSTELFAVYYSFIGGLYGTKVYQLPAGGTAKAYSSGASDIYIFKVIYGNTQILTSKAVADYVDDQTETKVEQSTYEAGVSDAVARIPFGKVDATSTSTVFTATVPNITELKDGVCCYLMNGVVTSATNWTLNINGLGAKPVYRTMAAAGRATTQFDDSYTMLFVYNSTRVDGGCWDMFYGYNTNENSIGYDIRDYYTPRYMYEGCQRYQFLLTRHDGKLQPVYSGAYTTGTTKTLTTASFNPFGQIYFYNTTGALSSGDKVPNEVLYTQSTITLVNLRYSFNTGTTLVAGNDVYLVMVPQDDGSVKLHTNPIAFVLPSSDDGLLYKKLGKAYDTYRIILEQEKPVYYYKDDAVRLWTNAISNYQTKIQVIDLT